MDGRWVVVAILLGYLLLLVGLSQWLGHDDAWCCLGVPALQPSFADLRGVIAAADSLRAGYDPLVENPADPWQRPLNYPRLSLAPLLAAGVHQSQTWMLGLALALTFLGSALLFMGRIGAWQGIYWGLLLCAPPTMMALERGNTDLVIFVLLALTLVALRREVARPWAAYLGIFLCALLKLYPVCAFMLAWREKPRRALAILTVTGMAFATYLYLTRHDLALNARSTPLAQGVAYGSQVFFDVLETRPGSHSGDYPLALWTTVTVVSLATLARLRIPGPAPLPPAEADGLLAGGAMYVATFILKSNYNYRLVILLFAVPALLRLRRSEAAGYRRLSNTLLAAVAVGWLLSPVQVLVAFFVKEAANWTVFAGLVFLLGQFIPWPGGVRATGREPGVKSSVSPVIVSA